jgi:Flp pilus assembly protein TadG
MRAKWFDYRDDADTSFSRLRLFANDRRGATSLRFAASGFALMGLVGLGTESGTWYLAKRRGQNAADSEAIAEAPTPAGGGVANAATTTALAAGNANLGTSVTNRGLTGNITRCAVNLPTWGT